MQTLDLREYLRVLRRRRWLIILVAIGALAGSAFATARTPKVYRAEGQLFVGQRQFATSELPQGSTVDYLTSQLMSSYVGLVRTRSVAQRAIDTEALPLSAAGLAGSIAAVQVQPNTRLIQLSFESTDPVFAQRVVNAMAQSFIQEVERVEVPTASNDPAVKVSLVDAAILPQAPIRPQPRRNIALALAAGLALGVGAAFLFDRLDNTARSREEIEELTGAPVLAGIPKMSGDHVQLMLERDPKSVTAESFRKLRTAIQYLGVDRPLQCILVTSPAPQDGKSTVALNLAAVYAQAGLRTVLLEADMRRPSLHQVFPTAGRIGLASTLIGRMSLDQVVIPTPIRNLAFIPAGPSLPPNPVELLGSQRMVETLTTLRERADVIIIDTPPALPVADATVLASSVDGVLLVTRSGQSHRGRVRDCAHLLGGVGRFLGCVVNAIDSSSPDYEGYYYEYYGPDHDETQAERIAFPTTNWQVTAGQTAPQAREE